MSATVDVQPAAPRSSALGVITSAVAILLYVLLPAVVGLAGMVFPGLEELPLAAASTTVALVVFSAVAVVGIVAAVTRRGRGWGVAAIVIALANNASPIHGAIAELVNTIFG